MNSARTIGSVHHGFGEWLLQRLTAIYLAGFTVWMTAALTLTPPTGFQDWKTWAAAGSVRLAIALALFSMLVHAWLGMRSVFLDYLKPLWLRIFMHLLMAVYLTTLAFWSAHILLIETVH
jgi:succinate dehydrogenase / fumarate reductase membrane anchor subunit